MQAAAPSVLTVENDPTVRAELRLALEDAGFDVVAQANDGAEAVELVREHRPDLVVLQERGETSERILEEHRVPIVEVAKPFASPHIVEAVTGALARHTERTVSESRAASLSSIESLVDNLSYATPAPTELEQASWERGHVWRRISSADDGAGDSPGAA